MASITLAEASKLSLDDLVEGVIENIVTTNPIFNLLPFQDINGNSKAYNREKTLGDSEEIAEGGTITAKAPASYKKKNANLTTMVGDAEINGLVVAQNVGLDQTSLQIASKAKSVGRLYQNRMINGDTVAGDGFDGLIKVIEEVVTEADNAQMEIPVGAAAFTFQDLDNLLMQVKSKDGQVDFLMMNEAQIRKLRALQRGLGGAQPEYVEVRGVNLPSYAGIPVYRNDWIPSNLGVGTNETAIFAGNMDDGSEKIGISGLTAANNMGIHVENVGLMDTKDERIWRIKFYSGFVSYNELGVGMLSGVV